MGGYEDPIREHVEEFDLDDDATDRPFVVGRGHETPIMVYDRRQRIIVRDGAAETALRREAKDRARTRKAAAGHAGPLTVIVKGETEEEERTLHGTVDRQSSEQMGTSAPTIRDRWGNDIPFGYEIQYPDWVHKAME